MQAIKHYLYRNLRLNGKGATMLFREGLKAWRIAHTLRQKELADIVGISVKHLACIEQGHAEASSTVRRKICEITGLVENYHFSRSQKKNHTQEKKRRVTEKLNNEKSR